MPKKPPKNGFFYFMIEYKTREERSGRKFHGGLPQVSQECSDYWQSLTPDEKAKYSDHAKRLRATGQNCGSKIYERFTSQGVPLSLLDQEKRNKRELEIHMKKRIEQIIAHAVLGNYLGEQTVCFISLNYFCKTHTGLYIPAEVGVAKYNLKNGIIDTYHTHVNPGTLPLGMQYVAKHHAEETHRLPQPPNAHGEISYAKILKEINDFCFNFDKNEWFPVFTVDHDIQIVIDILKYFAAECNQKCYIDILSLRDLFFNMKSATSKFGDNVTDEFPSVHIAQAHIDRDLYEFYSGLGCELHDSLDNSKYCSLSVVKRWAYMISDHCCVDLNIKIMPGIHVPQASLVPDSKVENDSDDDTTYSAYGSTTRFMLASMNSRFENIYKSNFKTASEIALIDSSNVSRISDSTCCVPEMTSSFIMGNQSINKSFNYWKRPVPPEINDSQPSEIDFFAFLNTTEK